MNEQHLQAIISKKRDYERAAGHRVTLSTLQERGIFTTAESEFITKHEVLDLPDGSLRANIGSGFRFIRIGGAMTSIECRDLPHLIQKALSINWRGNLFLYFSPNGASADLSRRYLSLWIPTSTANTVVQSLLEECSKHALHAIKNELTSNMQHQQLVFNINDTPPAAIAALFENILHPTFQLEQNDKIRYAFFGEAPEGEHIA